MTGSAISLTESGDVTNDKTDAMYVQEKLWNRFVGKRLAGV